MIMQQWAKITQVKYTQLQTRVHRADDVFRAKAYFAMPLAQRQTRQQ